jgi:hypothetical protein
MSIQDIETLTSEIFLSEAIRFASTEYSLAQLVEMQINPSIVHAVGLLRAKHEVDMDQIIKTDQDRTSHPDPTLHSMG